MKKTKQLLLSLATVLMALTTINCGGGSSGSSTTAATPAAYGACTYSNGLYYYNGQPYATCPVQTTGIGSSACTYTNGLYYYNGQPYATCPVQTTGIGGYGYGGGTGNLAMCQGSCPPGLVSAEGGAMCMPQGSCGACYAEVGTTCYIGDYAHQFYGY